MVGGAELEVAQRLASEGRIGEATDAFRRAAAAGDGSALAALAKHLLIHRPDLAREGLGAAMAATSAGNGEAAHLLAVFTAHGVGFKQSWQDAFNALQHSAELGWAPSQGELRLLAGDLSSSDWKRLRTTIDVTAWTQSPPPRQLLAAPRVFVVENFASHDVCDWLVELSRAQLKPAMTYDPATGASHYELGRTNSAAHLILPQSDIVLALIRARIAHAIRLPVPFLEIATLLHYAPGQTFTPHHDYLDDAFPGYAKEIAEGGQRVLTFLLYLNDGFDGGETDFPLAGLRHKGRKGDAMFFWNVLPNGALDRQTLHAGLPPSSGEKWLLSQWVRNKPNA